MKIKLHKETGKAILYRVLGVLIPCIILLIYLLVTNSISSFIDYCILGIGTFENSISYLKLLRGGDLNAFLGMIAPVTLVILFAINIVNIKQKTIKQNISYLILFVFALAQFTVVYPIADEIHFKIAAFPTILVVLYYICKKIQEIKNIKVSIFIEHFMNIITISFVGVLILQAVNEIYLYTQIDKSVLNHFSNIPISTTLQDRILEVDSYIQNEERDVYILDSEAAVYMIPLDKYNKDFDMFLKGNLGSASEEGQIEKIKNNLDNKNYCKLILLDNDELIGFISIFEHDCEERQDLSPWYATMFVKKEYRGNGYSKILNDAILKEAKTRGVKRLYLKTTLDNYYEKFGAKHLETLTNNEKIYYFEI